MADETNLVRLTVDGADYGGWKSVRIEAGIERQARSFDLEITDRWPGSNALARRVKPGAACQVWVGADLVMTGYVDATPIQADGRGIKLNVKGRSKTADLVDCSPVDTPTASGAGGGGRWGDVIGPDGKKQNIVVAVAPAAQYRGMKLEAVAAALAAPYGIRVIADTETGEPIRDHSVQQGETVFESIDRMMRLRHVLSTDNERGDLVFIDPGSAGRCGTALVMGENVLSASAEFDYKAVFSEYICKGQRPGDEASDDDEAVTTFSESASSVTDTVLNRRRVRVFKQAGTADEGTCADRVDYERAHRAAKAIEAKYSVQGWRQADGSLWLPNWIVRVRDPILGLDADMVIAEVAWSLSSSGMVTEIRVGPPDGYRTKAAKGKKVKAGKGGGAWGDVK